jgi:hypothetical protein
LNIETTRYINRHESGYLREFGIKDIRINTFGYKEKILFTSGAGPCIVLAAFNPQTSQGLLGHFADIKGVFSKNYCRKIGMKSGPESLMKATKRIRKLGKLANTEIWLGGSSPLLNHEESCNENRQITKTVIGQELVRRGLDPQNITYNWSKQGEVIDVRLNRETGLLQVHVFDSHQTDAT